MAFWGANLEQLKALGVELGGKASELRNGLARLNSKVAKVSWSGPDADRFRAEWSAQHLPALNRLAAELDTAATQVRTNAERQHGASSR